jgi:hypothetical protein
VYHVHQAVDGPPNSSNGLAIGPAPPAVRNSNKLGEPLADREFEVPDGLPVRAVKEVNVPELVELVVQCLKPLYGLLTDQNAERE